MRVPPSDPFPHPIPRDAAADLKDLLGAIEGASAAGGIDGHRASGQRLIERAIELRRFYP